jgi:subtilase family serine protease
MAAGAVLGVPGTAPAAATAPVPGSVAPSVRTASRTGAVLASQQLTIQVWLKPNLAGATTFANAVAMPGSAEFHHYLSPDAYTARFGPSAAQAAAVGAWLTASGLTRVHASGGRDYVSATGPVSKVESAFGVQINRYRVEGPNGGLTVIQSNDRDVSVPTTLAPDVLGVTGLDNAPPATSQTGAPPTAKTPTCSQYWAQYAQSFHPAYQGLTKGSLPVCGYSADQIRAAYGATMTSTGKGQTVALIENAAPIAMFQTLTDYARGNHLPVPASGQFREVQTGGGGTCGTSSQGAASPDAAQSPYPDEAQMDSEALYAMAPGAAQLMVIGAGCNENQALLDAALAVLTGNGDRPSATIESNSWQIPLGQVPPQTVHAIDLRAAAEGVGMYFASGDTPGLNVTDSDPYATAVGGTTLGIGAKDNRLFETGWSDDYAFLDNGKWTDLGIGSGTGGGTSQVYTQPAYQKGVVPASMSRIRVGKQIVTDRTVPDIAADADSVSGILTGYIASGSNSHPGPYQTEENAGTSLACPLIAGLVADAQQGQESAFGFINPLIYHLAGTQAFHDILPVTTSMPQQDRNAYIAADGPLTSTGVDVFDSQEHAYTEQVTAKGYDTMTGVGTPNGADFIAGLRDAAR